MKQKFLLLLLLIGVIFPIFATKQTYALMPLPPVNTDKQTLFGENQYYTVTFRGNGEAIVTMKAIITNNNDKNLSSLSLQLPSHFAVNNIIGYQVIAKPQCVQYSNQPVANPNCLQYQQPDYQYVANDTTYQKLSIQEMNNALSFVLPTPIKPNDTGSYLLSFRTFDFTNKNLFGAYNFTFQSLKVDDQINALQIGIATDSDLFIKGAKGTVNYDTAASMKALAVPQASNGTMQSQQFNDFYNQIGQGSIIKNVSNLESMESYTTTGMYADSSLKLYGKEIAITGGSIILALVLIFGIIITLLKKQSQQKSTKQSSHLTLFLISTGISFGSVLIASGYTIVVFLLVTLFNTNNYYGYTNGMFTNLLITGLSGAVYLFFLFVPSIIMSIKKGLVWGGVMLGLTIMWAIMACIVLFGVSYLFMNNNTPSPIVRPLMRSGQSAPAAMEKTQ